MSVLITGGTGFLGACLARRLQSSEEVHVILRPESNLWRLRGASITPHRLDLADFHALSRCISEVRPKKIFHLAGYGVYPQQKSIPRMFRDNVLSSVNLLRSMEGLGIESLVYTGSAFEYGFVDHPISESDAVSPPDIYSVSKASVSSFFSHEGKSKGLPISVARLFLAYGYYEASTRLIPTLITSYMNNQSPQLACRGNVRDFIFVEDVVDALLRISEYGGCGEVFNIGSGKEYSVEQVAEEVRGLMGSELLPTWGVAGTRQFEPRHWCADISKAGKLLGWEPKHSLEEGLSKTIAWYKGRDSSKKG